MFSNIHFFPFAFSEWNRLDLHIRKTSSLLSFKNFQLKLGQHVLNSHFKWHNLVGFKLLTILRVELGHLIKHKLSYNYSNCINPLRLCSSEVKSTTHFFLRCICLSTFVKFSLMKWFQFARILLISQILGIYNRFFI